VQAVPANELEAVISRAGRLDEPYTESNTDGSKGSEGWEGFGIDSAIAIDINAITAANIDNVSFLFMVSPLVFYPFYHLLVFYSY